MVFVGIDLHKSYICVALMAYCSKPRMLNEMGYGW
jgi:hypothetical protein